jgi:protocatechuate 3,4-dioxygenase beta subunit
MTRIPYLIAGLATLVAIAAPTSTGMASATKLKGTTGPGFTITLKKGTATVKTLRPGKYSIAVNDKSKIHNFRIKGPGLNKQITSLSFKGTKTATVTLKKGKYTYQCDPHAAQGMKHTFRVT